jgi:hypothetical protein
MPDVVELPPIKMRIFKAIRTRGKIGITTRELLAAIYDEPRSLAVIRTHIFQANEMLAGTDYQIVMTDRRHWIVARSNGK